MADLTYNTYYFGESYHDFCEEEGGFELLGDEEDEYDDSYDGLTLGELYDISGGDGNDAVYLGDGIYIGPGGNLFE